MCVFLYLSDGVSPIHVDVLEDVGLRFGEDFEGDLEVMVLEWRGWELGGQVRLCVHLIPEIMTILRIFKVKLYSPVVAIIFANQRESKVPWYLLVHALSFINYSRL